VVWLETTTVGECRTGSGTLSKSVPGVSRSGPSGTDNRTSELPTAMSLKLSRASARRAPLGAGAAPELLSRPGQVRSPRLRPPELALGYVSSDQISRGAPEPDAVTLPAGVHLLVRTAPAASLIALGVRDPGIDQRARARVSRIVKANWLAHQEGRESVAGRRLQAPANHRTTRPAMSTNHFRARRAGSGSM
jgi:hypothetical protein